MALYRKRPIVVEAEQLTTPMEIRTLEGTMLGEAGDWIITGVKGEQYPCKPDVFAATYEPVEGAGQQNSVPLLPYHPKPAYVYKGWHIVERASWQADGPYCVYVRSVTLQTAHPVGIVDMAIRAVRADRWPLDSDAIWMLYTKVPAADNYSHSEYAKRLTLQDAIDLAIWVAGWGQS